MGINANLLSFDKESQRIFVDNGLRRKDVTSVHGALDGYQKGRCFYCFTGINAVGGIEDKPILRMSDECPRIEYSVISLSDDKEEALDEQVDIASEACDVDHFFPHVLGRQIRDVNFDGVWNLVLSCRDCNRGEGGKFARIPELRYLERLYKRNEYLILSHHPLRESLIAQTGSSSQNRWRFLKRVEGLATELLPGARWGIEQRADAVF